MGLARRGWKPTTTQHTASNGAAAILVAVPSDGQGRAQQGVLIKALASNTNTVWIGFSSAVTNSNGYPLGAGDSVMLSIDDPSKVYTYGGAASQVVAVIY